jgi:hypothetical protein
MLRSLTSTRRCWPGPPTASAHDCNLLRGRDDGRRGTRRLRLNGYAIGCCSRRPAFYGSRCGGWRLLNLFGGASPQRKRHTDEKKNPRLAYHSQSVVLFRQPFLYFNPRINITFLVWRSLSQKRASVDAGGHFRLIRIPVRNYDPKLFFPLASENAVDRQVDIVIVKPFGLAQDAFFLKA